MFEVFFVNLNALDGVNLVAFGYVKEIKDMYERIRKEKTCKTEVQKHAEIKVEQKKNIAQQLKKIARNYLC